MIALLLWVASAFATQICVTIDTDFDDDQGGTWWVGNAPRAARGMAYGLSWTNSAGSQQLSGYLGAGGCVTFTQGTNPTNLTLTLTSFARVNGVDLRAYEGTDELDRDPKVFILWMPSWTGGNFTHELPVDQTLHNLAVAMWAVYRSTMHWGDFSARKCCLDAANADGTCSSLAGEEYGWFGEPWEVELMNHSSFGGSGGSQYDCDLNDDDELDGKCPGVAVQAPWRFMIAHELGHVVVEKRMGARSSQDNHNPDPPACMASWGTHSGSPNWTVDNPQDPGGDKKASYSTEDHGTAAREGWATFFAGWLFNTRQQSECIYTQRWAHTDFDLDGDCDTHHGGGLEGAWSLEDGGIGTLTEPLSSDPIATWVTTDEGQDWLDRAEPGHCDESESIAERGTEADWARFFWDLTTDQGVDPEVLADLYVDMCPSNWSHVATTGDFRPRRRLVLSATKHGILSAVQAEDDNGQDR